MSSFISKLNLRPSELRLVVVVAVVVLVVLYALFVYPQFKEWGALQKKKDSLQQTLARFETEIARSNLYWTNLKALEERGARVESEAQALELQRIVTSQAATHGVTINGYTPGRGPAGSGGKTNVYFEEQTGTINFLAEEDALVNFLFALSSASNSLIRVSSMTLNPDPARMKLMGNITVVASYRKAAAKPGASRLAGPAPAATARPPTPGAGPASIRAAVTASTRPVATNRPASVSLWAKFKNLFSSGKSVQGTNAPSNPATQPPAKPPVRTNAPPLKK